MSSATDQKDHKTWLERIQKLDSSKQLDSIHEEVVDLFNILDAVTIDNDNARAKHLERITKISTNTILIQSPI